MDSTTLLIEANRPEASLRTKVRAYKRCVAEIKSHLDSHPAEWGRFQSEFNQEINGIFRDLTIFEKENLARGNEEKVYKLRRLFIHRFRSDFVVGDYLKWFPSPSGRAEISDGGGHSEPAPLLLKILFTGTKLK